MEISDDMSDFEKNTVQILDCLFERAFKSAHDHLFIQTLFGANLMGLGVMDSIFETINFVNHFKNFLSEKIIHLIIYV